MTLSKNNRLFLEFRGLLDFSTSRCVCAAEDKVHSLGRPHEVPPLTPALVAGNARGLGLGAAGASLAGTVNLWA